MQLTGARAAGLLIALLALIWLAGCGRAEKTPPGSAAQAEQGRLLLQQFGCGACHRIPGVAAADGTFGPPLAGVARRVYLGGVLPNSPDNMVRWIRAPRAFDPRTVMPDLDVSEAHARAMVAYLYRLH